MEAGETHLDMLAKPGGWGGGMKEKEKQGGGKKNGSWNWGVVGTTSSQRHLVPTRRNFIL
jgi:hypothetical protein